MSTVEHALTSGMAMRAAGAAWLVLVEASTWQWWHYVAWIVIVSGALELLATLVLLFGRSFYASSQIPHRGKHLDELSTLDRCFITFNKLTASLFSYQ